MKRAIQVVLALGISAFFIWRSLPPEGMGAVWNTILRADPRLIVGYVLILAVIHVIRTIRWGLLLEPLAKAKFSELNLLTAVGFLALMLLPFRLGELARPLLAGEHLKIPRTAAMASVVVERVIDGLVMALLLVALLWSIPPEQAGEKLAYYRNGGVLIALFWGAGLTALIFAVWQHDRFVAILRATIGRVSPGIATRIESLLSSFIDGLRVLPSAGKVFWFIATTGAYWFINGLGLKLLAPAFGLHFTVKQAFTVLGMQVIGAMIPAGPGNVGTMQTFTQWGIAFFSPGANIQAAAFANVVWALQFSQQVLFGMWFVLTGQVKLREVFTGLARALKGDDDAVKRQGSEEPTPTLSIEK